MDIKVTSEKKSRAIQEKKRCEEIKGEREKKKQKPRMTVCFFADVMPSGAPQINMFL